MTSTCGPHSKRAWPSSRFRALEELLVGNFNDIVGVDLMNEDFWEQGESGDSGVYREEFAHGGMSSGFVCLEVWRDRLIPLIVSRGRRD